MSLYKAAVPWRVALPKEETGENLPTEGASWRAKDSLQLEGETKFMGVSLNEVLGTIEPDSYFVWIRTPRRGREGIRKLRGRGRMSGMRSEY
jgi:hypothetical protein